VQAGEEVCFGGFFRDKEEKILLSCSAEEKDELTSLHFSLNTGGKELHYETEVLRNIITISVPALSSY
jgi:hypothetical protein